MKKNLRLLSIAIICLLIVIIVAGYYYYQTYQNKTLILYGNVDIRTVNLSFRVNGKLQTLIDEGDKISAGQILASLDNTSYQNSLQRATGILASAKAKLDMLESGYRSQEIAQVEAEVAQRQAAWKYANSFYQRQQGLWTQRVISANDLENAKNNRNQALAALNAAKDKLNQFQTGYRTEEIAAARGEWEQAVAALAQAKLDLADTILTTPSPGTILTRAIEPGTILTAGSTVFTVSLIRPVWVRAYVSEPHLGKAIPGREVLLYTDSRPDQPYHGTIGFVSPTAEFTPKSVQTTDLRTDLVYCIRVIVNNDADDMLRQGMPMTLHFAEKNTKA